MATGYKEAVCKVRRRSRQNALAFYTELRPHPGSGF